MTLSESIILCTFLFYGAVASIAVGIHYFKNRRKKDLPEMDECARRGLKNLADAASKSGTSSKHFHEAIRNLNRIT